MQTERRTFLRQSLLLSCATVVGAPSVRTVSPAVADTIWWRAVRKKDSIETLCSLERKNFTSVRQRYFVPGVEANVGTWESCLPLPKGQDLKRCSMI